MFPMTMGTNNNLNLSEYKYWDRLAALYQASVYHRLPAALWRHPGRGIPQALVDLSGTVRPTRIDFTRKTPGFALAPFVNKGGQETLFIKADLHLDETGLHVQPNGPSNGQYASNRRQLLDTFDTLAGHPLRQTDGWFTPPSSRPADTISTKEEFCDLVQAAIGYIKSTGIKKVVTSRTTKTPLPPHFDPVTAFEALCRRYPDAFVSLVSIPGVGTWLGASPELLLSLSDHSLSTVALAGTQGYSDDIPLSAVTWGAKEIEEQALVSDYIRDFFRQLELPHFSEIGPRTVAAGNVAHLQTTFEIELMPRRLLRLANQILHNLHPTSAVCGMPKRAALSFILQNENYDRAFYSGFLGPIHVENRSQLFVNLRCMQLEQEHALLYVGGGITQDSVPEGEWEETVLKSNTLLAILRPELALAG
jgi:isochorismate synthase